MFIKSSVLGVALLLAACGAPKPKADVHAPVTVASLAAPAPGPGVFRIDAGRSSLRVLVRPAGAMARMGHKHVISHRNLSGWVSYPGTVNKTSFALQVPVADFTVDDPALRAEEGPDFAVPVPDDARAGTSRHMMGPAVLAAAEFPIITVSSVTLVQEGGAVTATLAVSVAGHASRLVVPCVFIPGAGELRTSGTVVIRQSALGLVPFSLMLGAMAVQDEITVKFDLVAVAT